VRWREKLRRQGVRPEFVREYPYVDDEFSLCFVKTRFNLISIESGEVTGKTFLVHSYPKPIRQGQEFDPRADKVEGLLPRYQGLVYRQPDVRDALFFDRPVYICEGEKDVEYGAGIYGDQEQAFTSMYQGSEKMHGKQAQLFSVKASRSVFRFVMDRDEIGPHVAFSNAMQMNSFGVQPIRIEFYYPKVTANKADLADHVEAGYTLDDLVRVTKKTVRDVYTRTELKKRVHPFGEERERMGSMSFDTYGCEVSGWMERVRQHGE
jgi:hypothetical protein